MKPGRAGTMTYDYKRHGTTTLFAALTSWMAPSSAATCSAIAPGVHPLPQYDRGAGPCGKSDPRHRRQLCDPQASKGAPMAGAASPLDVPLHSDLGILAQRGRRLLRQAHAPAPQAWRVPIFIDPQVAMNRLSPRQSSIPNPSLDRRPKTRDRRFIPGSTFSSTRCKFRHELAFGGKSQESF